VIAADTPEHWQFSAMPATLDLGPGESNIAFVSITVPVGMPPGESVVVLKAFPDGDPSSASSVQVTVTVATVTQLEIRSTTPNQPNAVAGDRISQTFSLTNFGNSATRAVVELQTDTEWNVTMVPREPLHVMSRGQVDEITVVVQTSPDLTREESINLSLSVRLDEPGAEVVAQATTSITVMPSQLPQQSIYPDLEGRIGIVGDWKNNGEFSTSLEADPLIGDLRGERRLIVGPISIPLGGGPRGTFTGDQRFTVSFEDKNRGYVRVGDMGLNLGSPLLERFMWSRGADVLFETTDLGYRIFYARTRGRNSETDAGFQFVFHPAETTEVRLTGLINTEKLRSDEEGLHRSSVSNLGIYAGFTPVEGALITGELAGTVSPNTGIEGAWRVSGKYRDSGISSNFEWLHADEGFRGGNHYTQLGRIDLSWRPMDDLNLWTNYRISRSNRRDDESIHERDFTVGGAWTMDRLGRLSMTHRSGRDIDVMLESLDRRTSTTEYSYSNSYGDLFASAVFQIQREDDLIAGESEKTQTIQLHSIARVTDDATIRADYSSGRTLANDVEEAGRFTSVGVGGTLRLGREFDLSLNYQRNTGSRAGRRTSLIGTLGWNLPENRRLRFQLRSLKGTYVNNTEMAIEYSSPVSIPLSFFPVSGRVEGRVFLSGDPEQGIEGVRVSAGNIQTASDSSGHFAFPPLAPGEYQLKVDSSSLDINVKPDIALPLLFKVEAGSTVELEIPVTQVGVISGYVRIQNAAPDAEAQPDVPMQGVTIELSGETGIDYRQTDAVGHFAFTALVPGTYVVTLRSESLPPDRGPVEPTTYQIELAAGETRNDLVFLVKPVEREIIIITPTEQQ
jgi:hypothetical protein